MTQVAIEPGTLPEEYAKLGVTTEVVFPTADECRMPVSGEGGTGKTTFVAGIPRAIIIDADGGSHSVIGKQAATANLQALDIDPKLRGYKMYEALMKRLLEDSKKPRDERPFLTVIIDSLDTWSELLTEYILGGINRKSKGKTYDSIGEYGSDGSGYGLVYARAMFDINTLWKAGYRWVICAHLQEKEIMLGGVRQTVIRPSVGKGLYSRVRIRADVEAQISLQVKRKADRDESGKVTGGKTLDRQFTLQVEASEQRKAKRRLPTLTGDLVLPPVGGYRAYYDFYEEKRLEAAAQHAATLPSP